jgi:FkbM family methyltransferase
MKIRLNLRRALSDWVIRSGPDSWPVRLALAGGVAAAGATIGFREEVIEIRRGMRSIRLSRRHVTYVLDMARNFDLYYGAVEARVEDGRSVVDFSKLALHRYRSTGLEFELSAFPEEDSLIDEYFRWFTPPPGATVYDIGAHCGVSSFVLSKLVGPAGRVICFEPDEMNYEVLVRNIQRHRLSNVTCVKLAVAGSTGTAAFLMEGAIGSALVRHSSRSSCAGVSEVATITLAGALERWGRPSFIKMDIEGSEVEVLQESRELLRSNPVHFVLDTNHRISGGGLTCAPVERIFREIGYDVESEKVHGAMTTWAKPRVGNQGQRIACRAGRPETAFPNP